MDLPASAGAHIGSKLLRVRSCFTKADFRFVVAEQLRGCGIEADIVLEPMRAIPARRSRLPPCSRPSATATR